MNPSAEALAVDGSGASGGAVVATAVPLAAAPPSRRPASNTVRRIIRSSSHIGQPVTDGAAAARRWAGGRTVP